MLSSSLFRYTHNECIKLFRNRQLIFLFLCIFILPIAFSYLLSNVRFVNHNESAVELIQQKISIYFMLLEMVILPISILLFFASIQLEYRYKTFFWVETKSIDNNLWVVVKFLTIFILYVLILFSSLIVSYFLIKIKLLNQDIFLNIDNNLLRNWFWQLSSHFVLLPLPAFLTMFCVSLLTHRYTIALLLSIILTYVTQLNDTLFKPFSVLRLSINLNEIILRGSVIWKYDDFKNYYGIAGLYILFMLFMINTLLRHFGIFKLFNR